MQKYLKRERDDKVFSWDKKTVEKKGFREITPAEAKWLLGGKKGPPPMSVATNLNTLDEELLALLGSFNVVEIEQCRLFMRGLKNPPKGAALSQVVTPPDVVVTPPADVVVPDGSGSALNPNDTTGSPPATTGGDSGQTTGEKPRRNMNKQELTEYALVNKIALDPELTKKQMHEEIDKFEEAAAAEKEAQAETESETA